MQPPVKGFALAAAAAVALVLSACSSSTPLESAPAGSSTPVVSPGTASTSPSGAPEGTLAGTWATAELPLATWKASWVKAGGSPADAADFLSGFGTSPQSSAGIELKLVDGQLVLFQHVDGGEGTVGWGGSYTQEGDIIHAIGSPNDQGCHIDYRVTQVTDDSIKISVLSDAPESDPECGSNDLITQKAIYQAGALHRVAA